MSLFFWAINHIHRAVLKVEVGHAGLPHTKLIHACAAILVGGHEGEEVAEFERYSGKRDGIWSEARIEARTDGRNEWAVQRKEQIGIATCGEDGARNGVDWRKSEKDIDASMNDQASKEHNPECSLAFRGLESQVNGVAEARGFDGLFGRCGVRLTGKVREPLVGLLGQFGHGFRCIAFSRFWPDSDVNFSGFSRLAERAGPDRLR